MLCREATCLNEALLCPHMAPVMREEGEEAAEVIRRERQKKISTYRRGMPEKVFKISFSQRPMDFDICGIRNAHPSP